jgi:hypothetical protein
MQLLLLRCYQQTHQEMPLVCSCVVTAPPPDSDRRCRAAAWPSPVLAPCHGGAVVSGGAGLLLGDRWCGCRGDSASGLRGPATGWPSPFCATGVATDSGGRSSATWSGDLALPLQPGTTGALTAAGTKACSR